MDLADRLIEQHGVDAVTAALGPVVSDERRGRIEQVLDARLRSMTIVIENLYDPHNGAAALRSCEAAGLSSMHVVEQAQPFKFAPKVAIGCDKWVDVHRHRTFADCAAALRADGFAVYAAMPGAALTLHEVDVTQPCAFAFGNEHEGLTAAAVDACDGAFSIPMVGFTQSLNLSVSVAVTVHALAGRRRAAIGAAGDLDSMKRAHLRARWYALSVRGAAGILDRYVSESTRRVVSAMTRGPETS